MTFERWIQDLAFPQLHEIIFSLQKQVKVLYILALPLFSICAEIVIIEKCLPGACKTARVDSWF